MKILENVRKIPGGLMIVPMLLAAVVNTFCPWLFQIGAPTSAIFTSAGTMTVIGIVLVFAGISTRPRELLHCLKRGGVLLLIKLVISLLLCIWIMNSFGQEGFWGLSALVLVACMTSTNPGVYIAMMDGRGDELDKATYALVNLVGLPFVPICMLGFSAGYGVDWLAILATCVPFLVGLLLAALDPEIRKFAASGTAVMLPFLGFCLGSKVDLVLAVRSGVSGLILYVFFMAVNAVPLILADKFLLKQKGFAAAAICCVAGISMSVPALMAEKDPSYLPYVDTATAQLALAVALSAVVTPVLVKYFSKEKKLSADR
ncbi:MAG: 2-keto-3-deoxygluconate permease [Clostridiales bacterium]|nr:2-keto-3-deoxygluconate permease [Clostridiales bacterium]